MLNNPAINPNIGSLSNSQGGIGVMQRFINSFLGLAFGLSGIVLLVMLLWGGYEYITSGGDKEGTEKARKKMTTALLGIFILFSIYAIIAVVQAIFGINLFSIKIPSVAN